jgi:gliding motility-associatede transport system auxiliary component
MVSNLAPRPSFTPRRKWSIGLNVLLSTVLVVAVVVMANYLSHQSFLRLYLSKQTQVRLHSRTVYFLKSLTNHVRVTLYYDESSPLYSTILDLLRQYSLINPKITLHVVDYTRDPAGAQRVKAQYKLDSPKDKNLIIFDAGPGQRKVIPGDALEQYTLEAVPNQKQPQFRRKPVAFRGEMMFTGVLLAVTSPKPLNVYFLQGDGEHLVQDQSNDSGYLKFATLLTDDYIRVHALSLVGTNTLPPPQECNLLVIAGPRTAIPQPALDRIEDYLEKGGRLFVLFNARSLNLETGVDREAALEELLAKWGVAVGNNVIRDAAHSEYGWDVVVSAFSLHPVVDPLLGSGLYLVEPRSIGKLDMSAHGSDAPQVEILAQTGPKSSLVGDETHHQAYPVMVAVEKKSADAVIANRGATRILVLGDSSCLDNGQIGVLGNRDFAGYAVNWLLDRPQLLRGVGPRPVTEYRLIMTQSQMDHAQWLLLGGMPGAILVLGGLVWLRRRH